MARIAVEKKKKNKKTHIALTYIHGIGMTTGRKICEKLNIPEAMRVHELTEDDVARIKSGEYQVEGDLRRVEGLNIKRLIEINCYRGQRHRKGLPTRGQRTKTNARTRRGRKRLAVAGKKTTSK